MSQLIAICKLCYCDIAGYKSFSLPCWHIFHSTCLRIQMRIRYCCPICFIPFTSKLNQMRISKKRRCKEYAPKLHPINEESSFIEEEANDHESILETETMDQISFESPPNYFSQIPPNILILQVRNNVHEIANRKFISPLPHSTNGYKTPSIILIICWNRLTQKIKKLFDELKFK